MSDLCIYELEDNVWDEFGTSDDHIVPHPSKDYKEQFEVPGDKGKNQRWELTGVSSKANNRTIYDIQRKENYLELMSKKDQMPQKVSWSNTPDGVFPASCDSNSVKEVINAAYHDKVTSSPGLKSGCVNKVHEFCVDDSLLDDSCAAVDDNMYGHPLNHISQTDTDLSFLANDREDKESSDLFYGWPDIGSFEDVDRMFRSCDSTFGLDSLPDEDDLCWFSSTKAAEASEDVLKSSSKLDDSSDHRKFSAENCMETSSNDCNKENGSAGQKSVDAADGDVLNHMSFGNELDAQSESKDVSQSNDQEKQNNLQKKQLKNQNLFEGKRKDGPLGNGGCLPHYVDTDRFEGLDDRIRDSNSHVLSPSGLQHHKQKIETDSLSYMQTHNPYHDTYVNLDYNNSSDQTSVYPTPSSRQSENNFHMSRSPKESSYASNPALSMESSQGQFEGPFMANNRGEKLYKCQDLWVPSSRNARNANVASPQAFGTSLSAQKQVHPSELEMEVHSDIEGVSIGVPAELELSNMQESSCMSSMAEDISLEASSFRQLQQVMEKLDIRTKLCIRDSLYRLARSAEQRHNFANSGSRIKHNREASGVSSNETNSGYIDIETNTNPIDRSVAHLLFHRPLDVSVMHHRKDALLFNSPGMVHESITSAPAKLEKELCPDDANEKPMKSDEECK